MLQDLMGQAPKAAAPEAGVVDLLRRLRSHICCESRSDFRRVLPVYQRLLSPREDAGVSVQYELLEIRAKLLACGEDADVVDAVDHMDQMVEHCLSIEEKQQQQSSGKAAVPMHELMRLLVALAGGEDGETFVLEDPMQVTSNKTSMFFTAEKKRIGDCIRMNDIELIQRSRSLFHKAPVSMQEKALFSQDLFSFFGNGISSQHTSLWCTDTNVPGDNGLLDMMPFKQPNRFFGLPGSPHAHNDSDLGLTQPDTPKRQRHDQALIANTKVLKAMKPGKQTNNLSPRKEVFFYDGTQEVHCRGQTQPTDWGEVGSITENSSWGSESSFDISEPWIAKSYAWEDLGDRRGLPKSYANPWVREQKRSLQDLVIPDDFGCGTDTPLEIHEKDLIEDSLRALSGVDSTIFRRDFQSATFQLPGIRRLKLPNTSVSATMSVLEVFRKAGTTFMRLELLAVYYSQDPGRGGKTLQAMGDALYLYLSAHRTVVESIAQQCLESSSGERDEGDAIMSVTKLVGKTRNVCRVLEAIGRVFRCEEDVYWPLLQQGKFPRGIALLDHLHRHVSTLRVEDSSGRIQELVTWFLVKSCSPLLAMLSDLISLGRVDESTDPFDEFEATMWSRNLLEKASAGSGDGLFSEVVSTEAVKMLPNFLGEIASYIIHLSQVQALLRSVNAIASTHSLVTTLSLIMVTRGDEATEIAEEWKSTILAFSGDTHYLDGAETHKGGPGEMVAPPEEPGVDFMREDREKVEAKRSSQLLQRNMLDQQVSEKKQRRLQLTEEEEADEAKRVEEAERAQADQEAYGRDVLLDKYSVLMNGAEQRHDYMKWRRDRAVRLSTAKEQLQRLRADDVAEWTADMETRPRESLTRAAEGEAVNAKVGEIPPELALGSLAVGVSSIPVSTSEWRASVKVNQEAGNRTPASTDEGGWRASVKVNKEAGSRTSASIDDGARKTSVKVNKEAGSRTSASIDGGTWRASVKVNKEAGSRCGMSDNDGAWRASVRVNREAGSRTSGVLNDSASTEVVSHRTGVRILNEPGGSGANMYGTLYGGYDERRKQSVLSEAGANASAACAEEDAVMEDGNNATDQSVPPDERSSQPIPVHTEDEDVEMQNPVHDEEESANRRSDLVEEPTSEASEMAGAAAEPANSTRLSLPPVHPFFCSILSQEDSEMLTRVLAETATDSDFTSFTSIIDCCVEVPVRLVGEKLEQVAVAWFCNSLQVLEYLRWLRRLMLMSEGLCMDIFARDFIVGLNSTTRVNWGFEGRLSSALTLAMIEGSVTLDAISQNFHYQTTPALSQVLDCLTMTPAVPSLLNEIKLVYDVKWPLGFMITTQSLKHYQQMHQFLLYVRLTSLEMREAWGMLRSIRRQEQLSPALERLCGGVVYLTQAFLRAFNETFATKVLMAAWTKLEQTSQKATTLVELRRCHEEYVSVAVRCCFLDKSALAIRSAFLDMLAACWRLTGFVRALERQVTGRTSEDTRIRALCEESDVALRVLVGSLQNVTREAERNTREFSECLLLRLNFNQYYSTECVPVAAASERVSGADDDVTAEF